MNAKATGLFLIGAVAVSLCASAVRGDVVLPIRLDFNSDNNITNPGWIGVTGDNRHDNGTAVDCGGGVFAGATVWGVMSSRDRGVPHPKLPPFDQDLFRDFLQVRRTEVCFKVTGLPAGTYLVSVLAADPSYPVETGEDNININGVLVDIPGWPADPGSATMADMTNTVSITLGEGEDLGLSLGTSPTGKLSGLIIDVVPEPASLLLLAGAGGVLLRRRRR